jgi:hypothetical protein
LSSAPNVENSPLALQAAWPSTYSTLHPSNAPNLIMSKAMRGKV